MAGDLTRSRLFYTLDAVLRGDWDTLRRHLDALPARERPGYQAGAALATQLAEAAVPVAPAAV